MSRFFIESLKASSCDAIICDRHEVHHITHVLRLKEGADVELVNGRGLLAFGQMAGMGRDQVKVRIDKIESVVAPVGSKVILACAIPKKAKFETILEKCTELGVDEIIPIVTDRTEGVAKAAKHKDERYFRVIVNACKQSKRLFFPVLHPVMSLEQTLMTAGKGAIFIPWLEGERVLLKDAVVKARPFDQALVLIGPEGDFTPQEAALAISKGAVPVSLGNTVLKVDTAALSVVSFIHLIES